MSRARSYRARGVVLRRIDFGEADRILTLFTLEEGKLRAIAKGVRRTSSRSGGHLELFADVELLMARGRDLDLVAQAETLHAFRALREDLLRAAHAYELAEIVDALTADRQPNPSLFHALMAALGSLEHCNEPRLVLLHFLLAALDAAGFRPQLSECLVCRRQLQPEVNWFNGDQGGALCPSCGPGVSGARPIPLNVLKLARLLQRSEPVGTVTVRVPEAVSRELERMLRDYLESILERQLRTPAFVARVREIAAPSQAP